MISFETVKVIWTKFCSCRCVSSIYSCNTWEDVYIRTEIVKEEKNETGDWEENMNVPIRLYIYSKKRKNTKLDALESIRKIPIKNNNKTRKFALCTMFGFFEHFEILINFCTTKENYYVGYLHSLLIDLKYILRKYSR